MNNLYHFMEFYDVEEIDHDYSREFDLAKTTLLVDKVTKRSEQIKRDKGIVDIPEFLKPLKEKTSYLASNYVAMIKNENKLNETLLEYL